MHEPPSEELVRRLTELQLCQPGDLRRARGRIRKLAFDLPTFDSVWIDSLVQLRVLTPYQARQLELGNADQLRIGSFVAIDELAKSHRGTTFLARRLNRRDRCVVKRQSIEHHRVADVRREMYAVLEQANRFVHPQLVVPSEILPSDNDELVLVSRFVPGLPLNELLVRRGRFPAGVVYEIGRQILEGLSALHARSLVHGDIRMSNVRLTDSGLAVLVDGGIRQIVHPQFTIHDDLAPDAYDGIAPELIGTGAPVTASSELYAVGCLLWQLLAGRPPYITADPLAKLAAHQTETIKDVRMWAPDTPGVLAEMIRRLTSQSLDDRPRSFDEVLQQWGSTSSLSRSRLRQFRRLFDGTAPHFAGTPPRDGIANWVWTTAMLVAVMGGLTVLYDNGLRNQLLMVAQKVKLVSRAPQATDLDASNGKPNAAAVDDVRQSPRGRHLQLPEPDEGGIILLTETGPYDAANTTFTGHLIVRGAVGTSPEILVANSPLNLSAQTVTLERVSIRCSSVENIPVSVIIRSERMRLLNCEFSASEPSSSANTIHDRGRTAVSWSPSNPRDAGVGQIEIENCFFHGNGTSLRCAQTPRSVRIDNTLKTGFAAFLSLGSRCARTAWKLDLDHVTLRDSGPLLRMSEQFAIGAGEQLTSIQANNCVFKLSGTDTGLIVFDTDRPQSQITSTVEFNSVESVLEPDTVLLARFDHSQNRIEPLQVGDEFNGLIAGEIHFSGSNEHRSSDSTTRPMQVPRSVNAGRPGIDPKLLDLNRR